MGRDLQIVLWHVIILVQLKISRREGGAYMIEVIHKCLRKKI